MKWLILGVILFAVSAFAQTSSSGIQRLQMGNAATSSAGTCGSSTINGPTGKISPCFLPSTPHITDYTLQDQDSNGPVVMNCASPCTLTIPAGTATGNMAAGWTGSVVNENSDVTVTPASTLIGCHTSLVIHNYDSMDLASAGGNYVCRVTRGP